MGASAARHVVVVGGGISGLAAAEFLRRGSGRGGGPRVRVTVLEGSAQVGGKLRVSDVAGAPVDEGAESLLLRRPEGTDLATAAGLGADLVTAATTAASIWSRGELRRMPQQTVMGVPTDLRSLAATGLLSPAELARIPLDEWLPRTAVGDDVPVGRFVATRMGRAVVDRLVEPLLGSVYAGHADLLSLDATIPQLAAAARRERSLLAAARAARDAAPPAGPVFGALRGGLGRLPSAVAVRSRATVRLGATVRELRRLPEGWALTVGSTRAPEVVPADAVVLAVPAAPAARLLRSEVPAAATDLAAIAYASMAIVTLVFPASDLARWPEGSGFLVPPVEGRAVKAVTFSSSKWSWYDEAAPGLRVVRLSLGRLGEEAVLQRDDDELVDLAVADLADAVGPLQRQLDARVTRWGGALPQYAVGHRARVDRIRAAVGIQPGLAVCGAAYDGIGIPACVASAARAVSEVLGQWAHA